MVAMAGHHIKPKTERLEIRLGPYEMDLLRRVTEADPSFSMSSYVRSLIVQCARFDLAELRRGGNCIRNTDTWVRKTSSDGERLRQVPAKVDPKIRQAPRAAERRAM